MINLVSIASRRFKDRSHLLHIFEEHSVFRHLMNVLGNIKKVCNSGRAHVAL